MKNYSIFGDADINISSQIVGGNFDTSNSTISELYIDPTSVAVAVSSDSLEQ